MVEELSEAQVAEYKEAFSFFDQDGDGVITKEELGSILTSIGILPSQDLLHQMMTAMDTDGSGSVDFNEFLAMMTRMKADMLRDQFKIFDKDGDGFISTEELKEVLVKLGVMMTDAEAEAMIREADADGDGRVSWSEYVATMKSK